MVKCEWKSNSVEEEEAPSKYCGHLCPPNHLSSHPAHLTHLSWYFSHPSAHPPPLPTHSSIHLPFFLSTVYSSICLPTYPPISHSPTHPPIHPFILPRTVDLFIHLLLSTPYCLSTHSTFLPIYLLMLPQTRLPIRVLLFHPAIHHLIYLLAHLLIILLSHPPTYPHVFLSVN